MKNLPAIKLFLATFAIPLLVVTHTVQAGTLADDLAGKILLQVEANGEAWYVHPESKERFFLNRPHSAFEIMREQGVGITNANINLIPIGISSLSGADTDGDGLTDAFEDAVGTAKENTDTDGDGYSDYMEIQNGFNPLGEGVLATDATQ